jgi:hypothetical protein
VKVKWAGESEVALVKNSRESFVGTWGSDMVEVYGDLCSMRLVGWALLLIISI